MYFFWKFFYFTLKTTVKFPLMSNILFSIDCCKIKIFGSYTLECVYADGYTQKFKWKVLEIVLYVKKMYLVRDINRIFILSYHNFKDTNY